MNIKRIIREEIEGLKDSSQEDWGVFNNDIEWTEDLLVTYLKHKDIEFKAVDEDDNFTLELNKDEYDSGYSFIVSWDTSHDSRDWVGYSLDEVLNGLNGVLMYRKPWVITNM